MDAHGITFKLILLVCVVESQRNLSTENNAIYTTLTHQVKGNHSSIYLIHPDVMAIWLGTFPFLGDSMCDKSPLLYTI